MQHCIPSWAQNSSILFLQGEVLGLDPREVNVPVIGGHAGITILPLLSQVRSIFKLHLLQNSEPCTICMMETTENQ
jgi:malate/lactate dehydrogenase